MPLTVIGNLRPYDPIMVAHRRATSRALRPGLREAARRAPAQIAIPSRSAQLSRLMVNLTGAVGAAFFALASFQFYLQTHRLIGAGFCIEQAWFVVAFLVRRPARAVTRRTTDWLLAVGGSFGGTGFRPAGLHPAWGIWSGLAFQTAGLIIGLAALIALGRSFGVAPADRGLVTWGPYAMVRHPVYTSYLLVQSGYLLQSLSWPNALVLACTAGCNIGRALAEERLLTGAAAEPEPPPVRPAAARPAPGRSRLPAAHSRSPVPPAHRRPAAPASTAAWARRTPSADYAAYREKVRWRLVPGLW